MFDSTSCSAANATCDRLPGVVLNNLAALVVFDSRLSDLDVLYQALLPGVAGFTIDANDDALLVITGLLAETGAKRLSIVAHGEPGVIHLGKQPIDLGVLGARSGLLQEWCADEISLYSCEVGANTEFVRQLELVTGATVAASTTKVGSELLGGNWNLGAVSAAAIFTPAKISAYAHVLPGDYGDVYESGLVPAEPSLTNGQLFTDPMFGGWEGSAGDAAYGSYTIDESGQWTYALDNENSFVDALNIGDTLSDTFTAYGSFGYSPTDTFSFYPGYPGYPGDGTSQTVTITINGTDDAPYIEEGSSYTGYLDEASGSNNSVNSTSEYSRTDGTVTYNDVDTDGPYEWVPVNSPQVTTSQKGSFIVDTEGNWTYDLNNNYGTVQRLQEGESTTDTFTLSTTVGLTQTVTVVIYGGNDQPIVTNTAALSGSVVEAGGVNNDIPGTPRDTKDINFTDVDNNNDVWQAGSGEARYGTYQLSQFGQWTYDLANDNSEVEALNVGDTLTDTFSFYTGDGTSQTVTITINGTDDAPYIEEGSSYTGYLDEASGSNNSVNSTSEYSRTDGRVTYNDVDTDGPYEWVPVNSPQVTTSKKGSFIVDTEGNWTYDLNNNYGTVQRLQQGESTTDTFTLSTTVGLTQTVTVVIYGGNDLPTVTNPTALYGSVVEAGGVSPYYGYYEHGYQEEEYNVPGTPSVTKNINFTDVDNTSDVWAPSGSYTQHGMYSINALGAWTYDLNNDDSAVQALNDGDTLTDTFVVYTNDGTSETVSITINGTNDAAVVDLSYYYDDEGYIYSDSYGGVTEQGGYEVMSTTSGDLYNYDIDNPSDAWTPEENIVTESGYGSYTINEDGQWTYILDNSHPDVEALNEYYSMNSLSDEKESNYLEDTFVVTTIDGTSKTVTIEIYGQNDDAVITGDVNNMSVTEHNTADDETPTTVSGTLTYTDVDNNPADGWYAESAVFTGQYGTYDITAEGVWTYTLNNNNGDVDGLQDGQSLSDSFVVETAAGTTQTVTVQILGTNDVAVISGLTTAYLYEDGYNFGRFSNESPSTSGNNLNYTDPDNIEDGWQAVSEPALSIGGYGSYTIDVDGVWSYSLNEQAQTINGGLTVVDTFVVYTTDGTTQTISVNIFGENDSAVITNAETAAYGSATEASGVANGTPGSDATGNLDSEDIDANETDSWTVQEGAESEEGYGSYTVAADGQWTYAINNSNSEVEALNIYDTLTDTFTVQTIDGTTQTVTVTINGENDAAVTSSSYEFSSTEYQEIDLVPGDGVTSILNDVDDEFATVSLGDNSFNFYGTTYNEIFVSSNGLITFGDGNDEYENGDLSSDPTQPSIAVLWDDIVTEYSPSSQVLYRIQDNQLIVEWSEVDYISADGEGSNRITFQAILALNTGSVPGAFTLNYVDLDGDSSAQFDQNNAISATVGISNGSGNQLLVSLDDNNNPYVGSGRAITFFSTDDSGTSTTEDVGVGYSLTGTLIATDVDNDGSWTESNGFGAYGDYQINADGNWSYQFTNVSEFDALNIGDTLTDTFTVETIDGTSKTVTVTINGVNDAPVLTGEVASLTPGAEDTVYTINQADLLAGFTDVDGGELSVADLNATDGIVTDNGDGSFSFAPGINYNGQVELSYNVVDGNGGFTYATQSFNIAEAPAIKHAGDFDGDGQSEILWRHSDGSVAIWQLDGTSDFNIASAPIIADAAGAPKDWKIADTGDFDGDGKSEIVWRSDAGSVAIWKLDGTSAFTLASAPVIADGTVAPTDWKISGTGDFDGDGKSEIVWRSDAGSVSIWQLDGTSNFNLAAAPIVGGADIAPPNWKISGTGDFDGDGKSEILWYNNDDGSVAIWQLDGTSNFTLASAPIVGVAPENSKIKGIDDLDGDGKSEIVWRNNDGSVAIWKLDGTSAFTLASETVIDAANAPTDWRTSATGDFNGNGGSEILWRNTSGTVAVWELDGTSSFLPVAAPVIASAASAPSAWGVIAAPI